MERDRDLIDYLGIYRARTIPKTHSAQPVKYHYQASTKARRELERWPAAR
nr:MULTISPECIES: hypothetical protein [Pseudomonas]